MHVAYIKVVTRERTIRTHIFRTDKIVKYIQLSLQFYIKNIEIYQLCQNVHLSLVAILNSSACVVEVQLAIRTMTWQTLHICRLTNWTLIAFMQTTKLDSYCIYGD